MQFSKINEETKEVLNIFNYREIAVRFTKDIRRTHNI